MARAPYPIRWGKAVTDSDLGRRERLVCFALLLHMDIRGICRPTVKTISDRSTYGERSVFMALNVLEARGWITRSSGRSGRASVYAGLIPPLHSRVHTPPAIAVAPQESREDEEQEDIPGGW